MRTSAVHALLSCAVLLQTVPLTVRYNKMSVGVLRNETKRLINVEFSFRNNVS